MVTPPPYDPSMGRSRWNPWSTLRDRYPDLTVEWKRIKSRGEARPGPPAELTLDPDMGRVDRKCVLGHEVTHLDLEMFWPPDAPRWLVEKGEARVRRETAERFVPYDDFVAWARRLIELEGGFGLREVAVEYDISTEVAMDFVALIGHRYGQSVGVALPPDHNASGDRG